MPGYVILLLVALALLALMVAAMILDGELPWGREIAKFRRLKKKWQEGTLYFSDTARIYGHPAYRDIIAMGEKALPPIFSELRYGRNVFWHQALMAITGANPVPAENAGDLEAVRKAWLDWGRQNGYDA